MLELLTRPQPGEVHLWMFALDLNTPPGPFRKILDTAERARAARLRTASSCARFVLTRAALRGLLGRYLHVSPGRLRLDSSAGKPVLLDEHAPLAFNLAHSHERAVLAFGEYPALGVDVEYRDPAVDCDRLARRVLSTAEWAEYEQLDPAQRRRAFFDAWARKEAVLKGMGTGLRFPPRDARVALAPGEPCFVVRSGGRCWHAQGLEVDAGYAGAVAVEGELAKVSRFFMTNATLEDMLARSCS